MKLTQVVVYTRDFGRALTFYRDRLGLTVRWAHDGVASIDAGADVGILLHESPPGQDLPPPALDFLVPDVAAAVAELRSRGVEVGEHRREEWGEIARFTDSEGNHLAVVLPNPEPPPARHPEAAGPHPTGSHRRRGGMPPAARRNGPLPPGSGNLHHLHSGPGSLGSCHHDVRRP